MSTGAPNETSPAGPSGPGPEEEPRRFGNYLLLKELGRGAQGVVFLAEDVGLRRKVALKMLTGAGAQSQVVRDRFRREAELASKFEHPGICGVHDLGEVDGVPYIAMQYLRGTTLSALIEKARPSAGAGADAKGSDTITIAGGGNKGGLDDVLRLVERAARALHVAHEAGLVHRDIKPANIMVTPEGHPVLLDFGLARDLESEGQGLTQSGQILGTPAYLAPEQIVASRGTVDRRTDVYALGVTLFECMTLKRPFESSTWDQLFHEILDGAPRNPRTINARIPQDLCTVIEVAMERDQARRYPTAEALAEDLRRVRSFEPIQAKAAGPIMRLFKWSRRSPGRAASAAAAVLFTLFALSLFAVRMIQRGQDLRAQLRDASEALVAADYVRAMVAVTKAQELDPESAEVRELKARVERGQENAQREAERKKSLAEAEAARAEASKLSDEYSAARARIEEFEAQLLKERSDVFARYADDAARSAYAQRESELLSLKMVAERTRESRSEALERAERLEAPWGGASAATLAVRAEFYLERWREALKRNDPALAEAMRAAVELYDPRGAHREELLGRGTLTLSVVPAQAELFLFRWEGYESLRSGDVIPRLVPVPTAGVGRVREREWTADFVPGDACLVVRAVSPGSDAARRGLRAGDLVVRLNGAPCADGLFVHSIAAESPLARAGIAPLARIVALDDASIAGTFDWAASIAAAKGAPQRVRFDGRSDPLTCNPLEIRVTDARELVLNGAPAAIRLDCLHDGEMLTLDVPSGAPSGLTCESTAYPLISATGNRVRAGAPLTVDPGSYLLLARCAGFEDQRVNVLVDRRAAAEAQIELNPAETTPPGFVYVPPGPAIEGGDPEAFHAREAQRTDVPGFFIARRELTNREWYEFVNDPKTLAKIADTKPGVHLYLPQDESVVMAKKDASGALFTWAVYTSTSADSPVLGLSWTDAHDYIEWRNQKALERDDPWRYDLPTESEWEKAARGVDGRAFPWGNRFDPSLTVCMVRKSSFLLDAPGGFEPRDESPYGVLDMAGSREEWLRDVVPGSDPPRYKKRGGYWSSSAEIVFRSAGRAEASQDRFASSQGMRLVLRKP